MGIQYLEKEESEAEPRKLLEHFATSLLRALRLTHSNDFKVLAVIHLPILEYMYEKTTDLKEHSLDTYTDYVDRF